MEMIFHSHANKTHVHKKSCALGLLFEGEVFWNSEGSGLSLESDFIAFINILLIQNTHLKTPLFVCKLTLFNSVNKSNIVCLLA